MDTSDDLTLNRRATDGRTRTMAMTQSATATWQGDLTGGNGTVSSATSDFWREVPTSWRARTEASGEGLTSPEELLAAAHASCFSMAFSNELSKAGFVPDRVEIQIGRAHV